MARYFGSSPGPCKAMSCSYPALPYGDLCKTHVKEYIRTVGGYLDFKRTKEKVQHELDDILSSTTD